MKKLLSKVLLSSLVLLSACNPVTQISSEIKGFSKSILYVSTPSQNKISKIKI